MITDSVEKNALDDLTVVGSDRVGVGRDACYLLEGIFRGEPFGFLI